MRYWVFLGSCWLVLLSACGFQLRGAQGFQFTTAFLQSESANRVSEAIRYLLVEEGITVVASPTEAQVVIHLSHEATSRRVLSVSAVSGKLREMEVIWRVAVEVRKPDETVLLKRRWIDLSRDYHFDEKAVLAMGAEETILREELFQDIVAQVMRRLRAVKL